MNESTKNKNKNKMEMGRFDARTSIVRYTSRFYMFVFIYLFLEIAYLHRIGIFFVIFCGFWLSFERIVHV